MSLLKLIRWSQCVQDTVIERAELCRDEGQLVLTARVVRPSIAVRGARGAAGAAEATTMVAVCACGAAWIWVRVRVFFQGQAPRVRCPEHGVVVAETPWARPGARFTRAFDEEIAWLTAHMAASTVAEYLRSTWRAVIGAVFRVTTELAGRTDRLAGLRRIGIDEISYRKGQRYLLCVVDHDTGRLVWAGRRNRTTLRAFFDDLGADRAAQLTHVSADGAQWIHDVVGERARRRAVPGRVPRRGLGHRGPRPGPPRHGQPAPRRHHDQATALKHTRWALLKNPPNLTGDQRTTLAGIAKANGGLYRAYLLKEQLRAIFAAVSPARPSLLGGWIAWAKRCRLPEFVASPRP